MSDEMKKKASHLDFMYEEYDKRVRRIVPIYEEMNQTIVDNINFKHESKLNILDFGIGAGYLAFRLLQKFPGSFLTGVDYEEKMVEKSRERVSRLAQNFELFKQNMKDFEFNRKYDIVVSVLAIHHLTDAEKEKMFSKISKNMNDGGFFVIGDAYHLVPESKDKEMLKWWEKHLKKELGEEEGTKFFKDTLKMDMYSKKQDQISWMKSAGFSEAKFFWEKFNYAVLVGKK